MALPEDVFLVEDASNDETQTGMMTDPRLNRLHLSLMNLQTAFQCPLDWLVQFRTMHHLSHS